MYSLTFLKYTVNNEKMTCIVYCTIAETVQIFYECKLCKWMSWQKCSFANKENLYSTVHRQYFPLTSASKNARRNAWLYSVYPIYIWTAHPKTGFFGLATVKRKRTEFASLILAGVPGLIIHISRTGGWSCHGERGRLQQALRGEAGGCRGPQHHHLLSGKQHFDTILVISGAPDPVWKWFGSGPNSLQTRQYNLDPDRVRSGQIRFCHSIIISLPPTGTCWLFT